MTDNATDRPNEGDPAQPDRDRPDRDGASAAVAGPAPADQSGAGDSGPEGPQPDSRGSQRLEALEIEGEVAADYLEALLDIADLDGDIDMDVEGDRAVVSIVGDDLDSLVGEDGAVLEALQELTRLAVLRETGERSRLMLDIGGFRARRRQELAELARTTADGVRSTGQPVRLEPMSPFERKVVHDAVAAAGLRSESEGEEPRRRVVVLPV
ncbi:MAG TPA: R3H domain-containing nucleic acid-binding protein [Jiangellales bacterium]|nr:R3H domain-containing nucleic acid-binding protein [Jiangellales bacterium]